MDVPKNARLRLVRRPGALDRYGGYQFETVHSDVKCRLQQRTRFVRDPTGDLLQIDATLWADAQYDFRVGDRLTLDNDDADEYNVYSVDQNQGVDGQTAYVSCSLTKQR